MPVVYAPYMPLYITGKGKSKITAPLIVKKISQFPKMGNLKFPKIINCSSFLLASELVKVQPMTGPVGIMFHMNYVSDKSQKKNTKNMNVKNKPIKKSPAPTSDPIKLKLL